MTDSESARECVKESQNLRRIASHCLEPTDGQLITLPEDYGWQALCIEPAQPVGMSGQATNHNSLPVIATPSSCTFTQQNENPYLLGVGNGRWYCAGGILSAAGIKDGGKLIVQCR